MRVLGLSAYYHDSAAALVEDGVILAAAQEERFSRQKHDASFPRQAAAWCLQHTPGPVDAVVYYEKPLLKFERILTTGLGVAPRGFRAFAAAMPGWLQEKLWLPGVIEDELRKIGIQRPPLYFAGHHESHAGAAFYPSPFERAAILTLDGVGEWATTVLARGSSRTLAFLQQLDFPHSPGLLYSAFTYHAGFRVNSGEYKLMGLAPYGRPRFVPLIREHLVDLKADGSFRLNLDYFGYLEGQTMTNRAFSRLIGVPPRRPEEAITQVYCDLARSVQEVTEEIVLRLARTLQAQTGEENLCLAGGVALNCVANARLQREGPFRRLWVQPAAGDAGGALGAALAFGHQQAGWARSADGVSDRMRGSFLGPAFSEDEMAAALRARGLPVVRRSAECLHADIAQRLDAGAVVGFFAGRSEFGPRALGARSILADARVADMQRRLNLKIKFRESFRPFAPVVLAERAAEFFDLAAPSPYMLFTAPVRENVRLPASALEGWEARHHLARSTIPAVTHVDYSARVQTVEQAVQPDLHAVLAAFAARTGCPVLINTSFNVRGEPPVCHPREAVEGFLRTEMDSLALGPYLVDKSELPAELRDLPPARFAPD
jgi:carbamoyltransferase